VHHYRQVTGVDLGADIVDGRDAQERNLQPSVLLLKQIAQHRGIPLPPPASLAGLGRPAPTRMLANGVPQPKQPTALQKLS
jgi:hypothetical protein